MGNTDWMTHTSVVLDHVGKLLIRHAVGVKADQSKRKLVKDSQSRTLLYMTRTQRHTDRGENSDLAETFNKNTQQFSSVQSL